MAGSGSSGARAAAPRDGKAKGPGDTQAGPLPLEPVRHTLLQRAVDPNVGHAVEPPEGPCVEIIIRGEVATVEEAPPDVAHRPFHLPLRLGPVRAACPDPESPVVAEAQELRVLDQPSTLVAPVVGDDGLHLVEQRTQSGS